MEWKSSQITPGAARRTEWLVNTELHSLYHTLVSGVVRREIAGVTSFLLNPLPKSKSAIITSFDSEDRVGFTVLLSSW